MVTSTDYHPCFLSQKFTWMSIRPYRVYTRGLVRGPTCELAYIGLYSRMANLVLCSDHSSQTLPLNWRSCYYHMISGRIALNEVRGPTKLRGRRPRNETQSAEEVGSEEGTCLSSVGVRGFYPLNLFWKRIVHFGAFWASKQQTHSSTEYCFESCCACAGLYRHKWLWTAYLNRYGWKNVALDYFELNA